jgi:hypothetical protein
MYKRLLSLVNNFIHVERAHLSQNIYCMLLNVTPETMEIQTFSKEGLEESRWILPMGSVTGVATHSAEIDRLALTVKYAQSPDEKPNQVHDSSESTLQSDQGEREQDELHQEKTDNSDSGSDDFPLIAQ